MHKTSKDSFLARFGLGVVRAIARLPASVIQSLGFMMGHLVASLPTSFKRVTQTNLDYCFPEQDASWKKRITRHSIVNTVMTAFEYAMYWFWPIEKIRTHIVEPDQATQDAFYHAFEQGNGLIILSPHMGAWESMLGYLPDKMKATMMYRPLRQQSLESVVRGARERAGAQLVPATAGGIRAMMDALKRNELVVILPDQVPSASSGEIVPFFNRPALTMTLAAKLAQKTGAKVMVGYVERLGVGKGFKPHGVLVDDAIQSEDLPVALRAMNQALETAILEHPEQYVWSYKRFKKNGERVY